MHIVHRFDFHLVAHNVEQTCEVVGRVCKTTTRVDRTNIGTFAVKSGIECILRVRVIDTHQIYRTRGAYVGGKFELIGIIIEIVSKGFDTMCGFVQR